MQIKNTVRPNTNTHTQIHTNIGAGCGYNYKCSCGHSTPPTASTCPPTIDALKDDVLLKPIIAPTIAENITLMRLSYTHFSRLDTLTDVSKKAIKICYRFRGTPQLQTNVFPWKELRKFYTYVPQQLTIWVLLLHPSLSITLPCHKVTYWLLVLNSIHWFLYDCR